MSAIKNGILGGKFFFSSGETILKINENSSCSCSLRSLVLLEKIVYNIRIYIAKKKFKKIIVYDDDVYTTLEAAKKMMMV